MTLDQILDGAAVFLDANILVYHLAAHPLLGSACTTLVQRIEQNLVTGFSSTHVLSEVAHRMMLIDASQTMGWPLAGAMKRLGKHPQEIAKLSNFRVAVQQLLKTGLQVLTIAPALIDAAAAVSQHSWLLSNDALIVALMQQYGLTNLASHDADFDRVPGLTRYAPA